MRRGAEVQTDQGPRLAEALAEFERDPGWTEHRRLPRSEAKGTQAPGSRLFLAYFLLAKQKKVSRPPRRQSGTGTYQRTGHLIQEQS